MANGLGNLIVRWPNRNSMKTKGSGGPTWVRQAQYAKRELCAQSNDNNSKNSKGFPFPELPTPAETDLYPNRIALFLLTELCNSKIAQGFLATHIRTKAESVWEARKANDSQ